MNRELQDVQAGFRKGRGTRNQIANIIQIIEKAREFQKNIYFCFIDYVKPWTVWITTNCGKFWKRWEYKTTFKKQRLEPDMEQLTGSKLWKGVCQGCILSPCLFNLYAEYIMQNARLGEAHTRIKIAWRNINNFRYVDDITLMAESGTKGPLDEGERGEWKSWLKTLPSRNEDHDIWSHSSWQIVGKQWKQWHILFSLVPKSLQMVTAAMKLKDVCSLEEKLWQT